MLYAFKGIAMTDKPTQSEEEYFAKQQAALKKKLAAEREAQLAVEEREKRRALHHMRCPKCGAQLEEAEYEDVHIDRCTECEGVWLDKGELETLTKKGFLGKLLGRRK
jgi:uncharacterized protein